MEARQIGHKFNNSDIFHANNTTANGGSELYNPHPFLQDKQHSDNRTRTSFQDSNIFGYKEGQNQTWQGTGRADRSAGIKTDSYTLAGHTPGHTLYNPEAGMAMNQTHARQTFVQPEQDMYAHNDPSLPKSRLGEEVYGVRDFDRQAAKADLMPNDAYWLRTTDRTNNIADAVPMTPNERRIKDVYGTYEGAKPGHGELKHATLEDWRNPHHGDRVSNVHQDINTFEKRAQELSSANNPLTTTDYSQYTPTTKQQVVTEDVEKRVRDALYSDLYGQTGKHGTTAPVQQRSEISSHTGIFSKEGSQKGYRWGEEVSAAERRQDFLKTTGFTNYQAPAAEPIKREGIDLARSQLRMPKVIKGCELESTSLHSDEFYQKYNVVKDHRETNVFSLRFNNLPPQMDAETLKAISGVKHVVRAAVKTDNIKNECTGEGEITIRISEGETKESIVGRFTAAGINSEDKPDNANQKKSNYSQLATTGWRDARLEFEEKRHVNTGYENQKISKIQNLNHTHDMGTNNNLVNLGNQYADVIRSGQGGLFEAQKGAENEKQLLTNWDSMRPQTAQARTGGVSGGSYMKPTESFNSRSKHVQDSLRNRGYY
jgi:hypothetical protein